MNDVSKIRHGRFLMVVGVFGLHRFKLQRLLVDGSVKSVWLRQVLL
jgi:hypothetical protein